MRVVYWVNQKFKDRNSIDASADKHIAIHSFVYQVMGVFCDRLKLGSTTLPHSPKDPGKHSYNLGFCNPFTFLFSSYFYNMYKRRRK